MNRFFTIVLLLSSALVFAQTANKLDDVKGNVEKITITTDKGEVVIQGKEAEQLLKKMKRPSRIQVNIAADSLDTDSLFDDVDLQVLRIPHIPNMKHFSFRGNGCGKDFDFEMNDSVITQMHKRLEHCFDFDTTGDSSCRKFMFKFPKHGSLFKQHSYADDWDDMEAECKPDGKQQKIVIMKRDGDKTVVETYTGLAAEKKIKELENDDDKSAKAGKKKVIIKEEKKVQKSTKGSGGSSKPEHDRNE